MSFQAQNVDISSRRGLAGGWLVAVVGSCVGLAIMGDSLMYTILPLAAPSLGISLPLVGVLLSVNRFIRLISNSGASRIFEKFGPRIPFIGSVAIGTLATVLYGVPAGFAVLFVARLLWGIPWSGLRQGGYQAIWTGESSQKGRLTGLLWGLVRLGSAIGVLVGGILYDRSGYYAAILFVIVAAICALPVALLLRWADVNLPRPVTDLKGQTVVKESDGSWRSAWETPVQRWLVIAGFFQYLLSGVVVSTTALFLVERVGGDTGVMWMGIGIATLTGMMHGVRWSADLVLGPAIGLLSDHIDQSTTAALIVVVYPLALMGALYLTPVFAILCLFVVLLSDSALHIVMSAAASGVAIMTARPHAFIGVFTTTTDAGSALGPLVAYSLVTAVGLPLVYGVLVALLVVTVLQYWRLARGGDYSATAAR